MILYLRRLERVAALFFSIIILPLAAAAQESRWDRLNEQANELHRQGKLDQAIEAARETLRVAKEIFQADDPRVGTSLNNLAVIYADQRRYDEAEPLYEQALAIWIHAYGSDDPTVASGRFNLAGLHKAQQRYPEAESLYKQAIAALQKSNADQATLVIVLDSLAQLYYGDARYDEAEPLFRQALTITRGSHQADDPSLVPILNRLGNLYTNQARYSEAALTIVQEAPNQDQTELAYTLNNLAELYSAQGNFTDAEPLYKKALAIDEKSDLKENGDAYATHLNNLGGVYYTEGRYAEAEPLLTKALSVRQMGETLNNLANLREGQGRYSEAESLYKRAQVAFQSAAGTGHPHIANTVDNFARLYMTEGRYGEAESLYKQSLEMLKVTPGENHPDFAVAQANLGSLYTREGRYGEAESLLKQALAILQTTPGPKQDLAAALNNFAEIYAEQGRYREAEQLYKSAISVEHNIPGNDSAVLATSLDGLARVYSEEDEYNEAESSFKKALEVRQKRNGTQSSVVAESLSNLASLYARQKHYGEAERLYKQALPILKKEFGPNHPSVVTSMNNLAVVQLKELHYADAELLLKEAVAIEKSTLGPKHPYVAESLGSLALIYAATNRPGLAAANFATAAIIFQDIFAHSFNYMSENDRLVFLDGHGFFASYYSFGAKFGAVNPKFVPAIYDTILWQKGIVVESETSLRKTLAAGVDPKNIEATVNLFDQDVDLRRQIARLAVDPPSSHSQLGLQLELLQAETNTLEERLARQSSAFAQKRDPIRSTRVQTKLSAGEAGVEIVRFSEYDFAKQTWSGQQHYIALVLRATGAPTLIDLGNADQLERTLQASYFSRIAPPRSNGTAGVANLSCVPQNSPPAVNTAGQVPAEVGKPVGFYNAFWGPLLPSLRGITRIFISTDGELNQVALGLIPTPNGLLTDIYDIRYINSLSDLLRPTERTLDKPHNNSNQSAVIFANPYFDISEAQYRETLLGLGIPKLDAISATLATSHESGLRGACTQLDQQITQPLEAGLVQGVEPVLKRHGWKIENYFEEKALIETIERIQAPRLLHIGTHGDFAPDPQRMDPISSSSYSPQIPDAMFRSRIYFAGANHTLVGKQLPADLSNGILTAYQASTLNLHGTELVVLSACETGRGDVEDGEGVFGLRRAFEEAGAEAVLMTLWEVPADQAQEILTNFYKHWLDEGLDKHQALRQAQEDERNILRKDPTKGDLPYYWGAFILVGR